MANVRSHFQKGESVVEASLLVPWLLLAFAAVFDVGFYAAALQSVQNAARAAVLHTSTSVLASSDSEAACRYALVELRAMSNARNLTSCAAQPLIVTATAVTGPDGSAAAQVTVEYQTMPLIPIPGLLPPQMTLTRTAQMRLRST